MNKRNFNALLVVVTIVGFLTYCAFTFTHTNGSAIVLAILGLVASALVLYGQSKGYNSKFDRKTKPPHVGQPSNQRLTAERKLQVNQIVERNVKLYVGHDGELAPAENILIDYGLVWLLGRGNYTSPPVMLDQGSYRLEYRFPEEFVTVRIVQTGMTETAYTTWRSGNGALLFGLSESSEYSVHVLPSSADDEWEIKIELPDPPQTSAQ